MVLGIYGVPLFLIDVPEPYIETKGFCDLLAVLNVRAAPVLTGLRGH